jgi:hypothetical protein
LNTKVWYGRVSYYVRHTFAGQAHDFAVTRWLDFVEHKIPHRHDPLVAATLQASEYPVVETAFMVRDIRDAVPVQRITGRWIPLSPSPGTAYAYQLVGPIRSRVHGWELAVARAFFAFHPVCCFSNMLALKAPVCCFSTAHETHPKGGFETLFQAAQFEMLLEIDFKL